MLQLLGLEIHNLLSACLNFYLCVSLTGCCTFDEPLSSCGYSQSDDDDLNWDQVNAPVKPSLGQGMPSGLSSFCFVSLFNVRLCVCPALIGSTVLKMLLHLSLFKWNTQIFQVISVRDILQIKGSVLLCGEYKG